MALDRDELAARLAAANLSNNGDDVVDPAKWAAYVVRLTDALLAALVPVAPASGAPATEPRRTVGAVVVDDKWLDWIVVGDGLTRNVERDIHAITVPLMHAERFSRWATREECERHGIPYVARPLPGAPLAAPSPAATPAAWVPSVGDVVRGRDYDDDTFAIVTGVSGDDVRVRLLSGPGGSLDGGASRAYYTFVRRATSSERAAAGLPVDESATKPVDRVALAKVIREDVHGNAPAWDDLTDVVRDRWLLTADRVLAFLKAKRGAS